MARFKVTVAADGTVKIKALEGSFEVAAADVERIMAALKAQGVSLKQETPIEQHRHDPMEVLNHVHQ